MNIKEYELTKDFQFEGLKSGMVFKEQTSGKFVGTYCNTENGIYIPKEFVEDNVAYFKPVNVIRSLIIYGEEMKVDGSLVHFGCATFNINQIVSVVNVISTFNDYISSNRQIMAIELNSNRSLTVQNLKDILQHYSEVTNGGN